MKKIQFITLVFILMSFLYSCSGMSDAGKVLRNEKIKTTDEFLVKKRDPLILPPDYNSLPEPGSINNSQQRKKNNIEGILKIPEEQPASEKKTSSVEQSIINKIGK